MLRWPLSSPLAPHILSHAPQFCSATEGSAPSPAGLHLCGSPPPEMNAAAPAAALPLPSLCQLSTAHAARGLQLHPVVANYLRHHEARLRLGTPAISDSRPHIKHPCSTALQIQTPAVQDSTSSTPGVRERRCQNQHCYAGSHRKSGLDCAVVSTRSQPEHGMHSVAREQLMGFQRNALWGLCP